MSLQALVTTTPAAALPKQATKQPVARINPRVRQALDLMVWDNKSDNEAVLQVGISVLYLRAELKKPHIRAFYHGQLKVLRERESSRNIHTLIDVRDQTSNQMARVQAVKALEQLDDVEQSSRGAQSLPGLQIVIVQGGAPAATPVTIEHSDT